LDEKQNFLASLFNQAVVQTSSGLDLHKSMILLPEVDKGVVSDAVIKGACIAQARPGSMFDIELNKTSNLSSFLASPAFQDVFAMRDMPIEQQETADQILKRKLTHLFSVTKRMAFVDAYFLSNLSRSKDNGTKYFLKEALISNIPKIEIITMHQEFFERKGKSPIFELNPQFDIDSEAERLEKIASTLKHQSRSSSSLTIRVLRLNKSTFPHDRYGELKFQTGRLSFTMGRGAETLYGTAARGARIMEATRKNLAIQQLMDVATIFTINA
jgi:hypothetical protein